MTPRAFATTREAGCDEVLTLTEAKRRAIIRGLRAARGNVAEAARLLMVGRTTLYRKIAELEIQPHEWGSSAQSDAVPKLRF
jgi:transcriptional regulator of acetoin/glycerol metabolism